MDIEEYLDAVNEFAEEMYSLEEYETLDAMEITTMCVCTRLGVEIILEDYDTG